MINELGWLEGLARARNDQKQGNSVIFSSSGTAIKDVLVMSENY
jgi:hypothetical protein